MHLFTEFLLKRYTCYFFLLPFISVIKASSIISVENSENTIQEAVFNYTLQYSGSSVNNLVTEPADQEEDELMRELRSINKVTNGKEVGEEKNINLLALLMQEEADKHPRKYLFASSDIIKNEKALQKAQECYSYHIIKSTISHPLLQVIAFLQTKKKSKFVNLISCSCVCMKCKICAIHLFNKELKATNRSCHGQPFPSMLPKLVTDYLASGRLMASEKNTLEVALNIQGTGQKKVPSDVVTVADQFSEEKFWQITEEIFHLVNFPDISQTELVLFLGNTGVGKSTLVNSWLGHEIGRSTIEVEGTYKWKKKKKKKKGHKRKKNVLSVIKEIPNLPIAKISHGRKSETTIPGIYTSKKHKLTYVDCAGFHDTRGIEQDLFNFLLLRSCIEKARSVKAIVCLINYESITSSRGGVFVEIAKNLQGIIEPGLHMKNIFWLFTRVPEMYGVDADDILEMLDELRAEKLSKKELLKESMQNVWEEAWNRSPEKNHYSILNGIIEYENVYAVNPLFKQGNREEILGEFEKLQESIPKEAFTLKQLGDKLPDVPSLIRKMFLRRKAAIQAYRIEKKLRKQLAESQEELKTVQLLSTNEKGITPYINGTLKNKLNEKKEQVKKLRDKIEKIEKEKEKNEVYRVMSTNLTASFFSNNTKLLLYNDLPFDSYDIKKIKGISQVIKRCEPKKGKFEAEYTMHSYIEEMGSSAQIGTITGATAGTITGVTAGTIAGTVVGAVTGVASGAIFGIVAATICTPIGLVGGAVGGGIVGGYQGARSKYTSRTGEVIVKFYVKRKDIQKEELERLLEELQQEELEITKISDLISSLEDKGKGKDDKNRLEERSKDIEKDIVAKTKRLEDAQMIIKTHRSRLDLISETYNFFCYNINIDDYLQVFIKEYNPKKGLSKNNEEEKKNDE